LGARVEAATEPTRSSILPGEQVRVTWLVGAPDGVKHTEWAFALCASPVGRFPEPHCEGALFAAGTGSSDGESAAMRMHSPLANAGNVPPSTGELLLLSAFCNVGNVALDPSRFEATCADGSTALLASLMLESTTNRNPEIAPDAVSLDGPPLPA